MPYPKRKYRKGYTIVGLSELYWKLEKGEWVYWRDKAMHPGFLLSMTLQTVARAMKLHMISEAIDQHKEYGICGETNGGIPC